MERVFTVCTYFVLTALWGTLAVLYWRYRRRTLLSEPLVASLLAVLALDAGKTLVESVYFGVLWGSRYEVLPRAWGEPLESPGLIALPKLLNITVALVLLWRVIGRFLPDELRERERRRDEDARLRASRERDLARVLESERRLQSLFSTTTDLVSFWVADRERGFVLESMNPAAKTFFSVDDGAGAPDFGAELRGLLMEAVATKHPAQRDRTAVETPTGTRLINTQVVPVVDDDGRVVRLAALSHDITELTRRAEEEEQRTRLESLGLLAGGVAHDFNNLLAVVKADVDLARSGSVGDDAVLAHAGDAIARARELVEQLMSTAGARALGRGEVDGGAVVDDTVRLLAPATPGVTLVTATALPAGQRAIVSGDRAQLQQIVLNLVHNAAEAARRDEGSGDEGRVRASVAVDGDHVVIVVEDNGPGIPAAVQARMFDPFFTTKKDGRGLGLSTVFGLAQAHGGSVEVHSEVGRGARFTVTLPQATATTTKKEPSAPWTRPPTSGPSAPAPAAALQAAATEPVKASAAELRVLLIDDDDLVRRATRRLLERLGHTVTDVNNGRDALAWAGAFDIAVVDVTMPDLDGPATLQGLRARRPNLPAVIVTGRGDVAVDDDVVLPKPFDREGLQLALARALDKARARS